MKCSHWLVVLTSGVAVACGAPHGSKRQQSAGASATTEQEQDQGVVEDGETSDAQANDAGAGDTSGVDIFNGLRDGSASKSFTAAIGAQDVANIKKMINDVAVAAAANDRALFPHAAFLNRDILAVKASLGTAIQLCQAMIASRETGGQAQRGFDYEACFHIYAAYLHTQGVLYNDYHTNSHQPDAAASPYIAYPAYQLPPGYENYYKSRADLFARFRATATSQFAKDTVKVFDQTSGAFGSLLFLYYNRPTGGVVDTNFGGARTFALAEMMAAAVALGNLVDDK